MLKEIFFFLFSFNISKYLILFRHKHTHIKKKYLHFSLKQKVSYNKE